MSTGEKDRRQHSEVTLVWKIARATHVVRYSLVRKYRVSRSLAGNSTRESSESSSDPIKTRRGGTRSFCCRTPLESSRARVHFYTRVSRIDDEQARQVRDDTPLTYVTDACVKRATNIRARSVCDATTRSRWNSLRDKNTWKSWSSPGAPAYNRGGLALALDSRGETRTSLCPERRLASILSPSFPSLRQLILPNRLAIPALSAIGIVAISHHRFPQIRPWKRPVPDGRLSREISGATAWDYLRVA